jgi:hypothetical protein
MPGRTPGRIQPQPWATPDGARNIWNVMVPTMNGAEYRSLIWNKNQCWRAYAKDKSCALKQYFRLQSEYKNYDVEVVLRIVQIAIKISVAHFMAEV